MLNCVRRVMHVMADVPAVIGYDVFNEPMGSVGALVGGALERRSLAGVLRRVRARARRARSDAAAVRRAVAVRGVRRAGAVAADGRANLVFAPHLYDATAILAGRYVPACRCFRRASRASSAPRAGSSMPLFIGEFGVLNGVRDGARMMKTNAALLDRAFASWTVWHYNPTELDWNDEAASIVAPDGGDRPWTNALVRPYPRAIAGEPIRWDSGDTARGGSRTAPSVMRRPRS